MPTTSESGTARTAVESALPRRRSPLIVRLLAAIGALVVIGIVVIVARLDYFGRFAADSVLANAARPAGREMPFTAGAIGYASGDIQIVGGMGQGLSCSLPPIADMLAFPVKGEVSPIGLRMRQACAYHDYCYRHGAATYGYTQADCDFALQTQAYRLCKFIESEKKPDAYGYVADSNCIGDARLVTLGVRVGGSDSFRTLDRRSVLANGEEARDDTKRNNSTYFEFDPYATRSMDYTVYRIADAPFDAGVPPGTKAIYKFRIRPSGTAVSYSVGLRPFKWHTNVAGNPAYLASAPFVVRAGTTDWFVYWQRVAEDQTTGRLHAWAPGAAPDAERPCALPGICILAEIGRHKDHPDDPELDQLRPADLGLAAAQGLSLVTLRSHSCLPGTNAPCYVHVLVSTDKGAAQRQPQEPLSINDRLSPKPKGRDHDRYRNFASLPFVLYPPGEKAPAIAWIRRDTNYQEEARLRRTAVDAGGKSETTDDTARSLGTVFLSGFKESDEPAFILGRFSEAPILATLTELPDATVVLRQWALPKPFDDLKASGDHPVFVDPERCRPGLQAAWLQRPPQILGRPDGTSLAVFSLLKPNVSKDGTFATLQVATLGIGADGKCPAVASRGKEIVLPEARPAAADSGAKSIEWGRRAFERMSRAPLLLLDIDGDGSTDIVFPEGPTEGVPWVLCSIRPDGSCPRRD